MNRGPIYAALMNRLPSAGYVTRSDVLEHWAQVPPERRPALFLAYAATEQAIYSDLGKLVRWEFDPKVYLYVTRVGDTPASAVLGQRLDELEDSLRPGPAFPAQTLDGAVKSCRISTIETDEGTLGGDLAVAIATLRVVAAP